MQVEHTTEEQQQCLKLVKQAAVPSSNLILEASSELLLGCLNLITKHIL